MLFFATASFAQQTDSIYHVNADAKAQIAKAVAEAKAEHKQVFLTVGGNWCKWCRWFYKFSNENAHVDSAFKANYVQEHINYSKENKNMEVMKQLGFPQRFGFPVFVILDENGNRVHTQNSGYLEEGEGYSEEKVIEFLNQWRASATDPTLYK